MPMIMIGKNNEDNNRNCAMKTPEPDMLVNRVYESRSSVGQKVPGGHVQAYNKRVLEKVAS